MRIPCHHILSEITPREQCKQVFQQLILLENAVTRTGLGVGVLVHSFLSVWVWEKETDTHKQSLGLKSILYGVQQDLLYLRITKVTNLKPTSRTSIKQRILHLQIPVANLLSEYKRNMKSNSPSLVWTGQRFFWHSQWIEARYNTTTELKCQNFFTCYNLFSFLIQFTMSWQ